MVHYMCEYFLYISYNFTLLYPENFIFLDKQILSGFSDFRCTFMRELDQITHFLCSSAHEHPEKLIRIKWGVYNVHFFRFILTSSNFFIEQRFIGFLYCLVIDYLSWNCMAINNNLPLTNSMEIFMQTFQKR